MSNGVMTTFTGIKGKKYTYYRFWLDTFIPHNVAGNYIIAKWHESTKWWEYIYVGEGILADRIGAHKSDADIMRWQPNYVFTHANPVATARKAEEIDLIQTLKPRENVQHLR